MKGAFAVECSSSELLMQIRVLDASEAATIVSLIAGTPHTLYSNDACDNLSLISRRRTMLLLGHEIEEVISATQLT